MLHETVEAVISSPTEQSIDALLDDESVVFWVDWREIDADIVRYCESVLHTGSLAAREVSATAGGYELFIRYRDREVRVPLTKSGADRHVTLLALNEALAPDHEVRLALDSVGGDTLAYAALPSAEWARLEQRYGDAVERRFEVLSPDVNPFA